MVFIFIIVLVLALVKDAVQTHNTRAYVNTRVAQGAFLPFNPAKSDMIRQDINYDWNHERKLFPQNYIKYLSVNPEALCEFKMALQGQEEIANKIRPTLVTGLYNNETYDPYFRFNAKYREKIKIYNDTGRYYN